VQYTRRGLKKELLMTQAQVVNQIRIEDFERYHARRQRKAPPRLTLKEVIVTMAISLAIAPFMYATFFLIPMMGQVTVGFAGFITALYLFFRRSIVVALAVIVSAGFLSSIFFMTIQSVKYRLEVPLFILIALGIPMTLIYTTFVGMKIWEIRGGDE
jgi:hypothetical protein